MRVRWFAALAFAVAPSALVAKLPCSGVIAPLFVSSYLSPDPAENLAVRYPGSVLAGDVLSLLLVKHAPSLLKIADAVDPTNPFRTVLATAPRDPRFQSVFHAWHGTFGNHEPELRESAFLLVPPDDRLRAVDIAKDTLDATFGPGTHDHVRKLWADPRRRPVPLPSTALLLRLVESAVGGDSEALLRRIDELTLVFAEPR